MSTISPIPRHEIPLYSAGLTLTYRICKRDGAEDQIAQASAASDDMYCITQQRGQAMYLNSCLSGSCFLQYGGTVTQGKLLTSDSAGRGIVASAGDRIIGHALADGVLNDIGVCEVHPGVA